MLPRLGKDAPDEDPFLLQEGIRFVVFDALVDNKHGGGEIFSLIDLKSQFPGLTTESPILGKELRQLIIEDQPVCQDSAAEVRETFPTILLKQYGHP